MCLSYNVFLCIKNEGRHKTEWEKNGPRRSAAGALSLLDSLGWGSCMRLCQSEGVQGIAGWLAMCFPVERLTGTWIVHAGAQVPLIVVGAAAWWHLQAAGKGKGLVPCSWDRCRFQVPSLAALD